MYHLDLLTSLESFAFGMRAHQLVAGPNYDIQQYNSNTRLNEIAVVLVLFKHDSRNNNDDDHVEEDIHPHQTSHWNSRSPRQQRRKVSE